MGIDSAYVGEDVPLRVTYDSGGTDPSSAPTITITDNSDGTETVSAAATTSVSTGVYEYLWDTSTANGAGVYIVEFSAEFNTSETKIEKDTIELED